MIGAIIVGIIAGFLAGKIMRGGGFGLVLNLLLGLVGGAAVGHHHKQRMDWTDYHWCGRSSRRSLGCIAVQEITANTFLRGILLWTIETRFTNVSSVSSRSTYSLFLAL